MRPERPADRLTPLLFLAPILLSTDLLAADPTTAGLQDQGWQVISKADRREHRAGIAPYENLTRVIQITTFGLAKDDRRMTCLMAYDSQLDKITETCRPGAPSQ